MCARGVNDPYKNPPVFGHGHNHPVHPPRGPLPYPESKDPNLSVARLFHEGDGVVSVKLTGTRCIAFLPDWVEEVNLPETKGTQEIMFAREKGQALTLKVTWAEDMVLNEEPGPASCVFNASSLVHLVHRERQEWISLVQAETIDSILEMIQLGMITFTQEMVDEIVEQATAAQEAAEEAQELAEEARDAAQLAEQAAEAAVGIVEAASEIRHHSIVAEHGVLRYDFDSEGQPLGLTQTNHMLYGPSPMGPLTLGVDYSVTDGGVVFTDAPNEGDLFLAVTMPRFTNSEAQVVLSEYKDVVEAALREQADRAVGAAEAAEEAADSLEGAVEDVNQNTAALAEIMGSVSGLTLGAGAGGNLTSYRGTIALGRDAMRDAEMSMDNVAIGEGALREITPESGAYVQTGLQGGTRNVAIGGNAGTTAKKSMNSVFIGRNSGQVIEDGVGTVMIGVNAGSGPAPVTLDGTIKSWQRIGGYDELTGLTLVGYGAGSHIAAMNTTALGSRALYNLKNSQGCVSVGNRALDRLQERVWFNGRPWLRQFQAGTYTQTGTTVSVTLPSVAGMDVGDIFLFRLTSGGSQTYQQDVQWSNITGISGNTLTITHPISRTSSGSAEMHGFVDVSAAVQTSQYNTVMGAWAGQFLRAGDNNVLMGRSAASNVTDGSGNVFIGTLAGEGSVLATDSDIMTPTTTANESVGVGYQALNSIGASTQRNVALGYQALRNLTSGNENTYLGHAAGRDMIGGGSLTSVSRSTAIGAYASVSGDDQVQLGGSGTTPYAYAALQVRSDARDKTDVQPLEGGADFIMGLRPVSYRWDLRDDYVDELFPIPERPDIDAESPEYDAAIRAWREAVAERDATAKEWFSNPEKDGSKARTRRHPGFLVQEVAEHASGLGRDFPGVQDHKVNGGSDVMTLAYEALIPDMVLMLQQQQATIETLTLRLAALEKAGE